MGLEKQFLFFFSALGAFNGLFLSFYFAFIIKNKSRATYFLAALLFVISVRVTKSVFLSFYPQTSSTFIQIGLTACFLIGPFLYLYTKQAVKGSPLKPVSWLIHIIPVIIILTILGIQFPYRQHWQLWQRTAFGIFGIALFVQWTVYIIISFFNIKASLKRLFSKTEKLSNSDFWLINIVLCVAVIWLAYNTTQYTSYIVGAISFSVTIYISMAIWFFKSKKVPLLFATPEKYTQKKIDHNTADQIAANLETVFDTAELYKNPNLKLADVAEAIGISYHQLSQYLNDNLGKSFSDFVNLFD